MSLEAIAAEIKTCKKCNLCKQRTNTVPGEGNPAAEILFIGEGPGAKEDATGRPFVGAAGKYLTKLLELIDLTRENVFIANVVKCRPPENRDPLPEEVETCTTNYLFRQIDFIKPKVIVTLGRHSMNRFVPGKTISVDHGKPFRVKGQVYFPIYHPAAALYRGALRKDIEADFVKLPQLVKKVKAEPQSGLNTKIIDQTKNKKKQQSLL